MLRGSLLLILLISAVQTMAQSPLSREKLASVKQDALETFKIESNFDFSFKADDLYQVRPKQKSYRSADATEISLLKDRLSGHPDDADLHIEIGQLYNRMFLYDLAYEHFTKAIQIYSTKLKSEPANEKLYGKLAEAYMLTRQLGPAVEALKIVLELDPADSTGRNLLPTIYLMVGQFEQARAVVDSNLKTNSTDLTQHALLNAIGLMEYFTAAQAKPFGTSDEYYAQMPLDSIFDVAHFRKLAQDNPKNSSLQLLEKLAMQMGFFAKAYFTFSVEDRRFRFTAEDLKQIDQLERYYRKALKERKRSNDFILYHGIAFCHMLRNEFKDALPWFRKAIKSRGAETVSPSDHPGQVQDNLISAYLLMGDTTNALKELQIKIERKINIDPTPSDYTQMARFHCADRNYDEAMSWCQKAIALDSTHSDAWVGMAIVSLQHGEIQIAETHLNTALKVNPSHFAASQLMGLVLYAQGDSGTAEYVFNKMLEMNPQDKFASRILDTYFK